MSVIKTIEDSQKKSKVTEVKSGDVVRIHQKIKEGSKERVQVFEGLVINEKRSQSFSRSITVRRIASGIGVEKTFLVHSPLITQIEVVKRSKVRRSNLSYMRKRSGKSARLDSVKFDRDDVNVPADFHNAPPEVKEKPADESKQVKLSDEDSKEDKKTDLPKEEPNDENKADNTSDSEQESDNKA